MSNSPLRIRKLKKIVAAFGALALYLASFSAQVLCAQEAVIIIPQLNSTDINHEDYYFPKLLKLALDRSEPEYGPYRIQTHPDFLVDHRLRKELQKGALDLIWSAYHPSFECELLPVQVSLLKDLNDYRLLLIRKGEQPLFDGVVELEDLRMFMGGMGQQWPDVEVLEANRMPLVTAPGYGKLFRMLAVRRFDYFSRGIFQISTEVYMYPELNLAIEQNLLLHYRNPYYFFVAPHNVELANRIKAGLNLALEDGSFDALFSSIPRYQWAQAELATHKRRVLNLSAPNGYLETQQHCRRARQ